jgi:hypothetical protein
MMEGKLNINQGPLHSEDNVNFYGTQIQLMQSAAARRDAVALVCSSNPELQPVPVELSVAQRPRASIFELHAIGRLPGYTQVYLNVVMQKYLDFKRGMREGRTHTFTAGITAQLIQIEKDRRAAKNYSQYDYFIIDSSPVLAADDTTSLAPKIDATLLVVRLSHTSARLTKKALELLYSRQVNVPGIILNYVDTSMPEYYYYQYSEYYNRPLVPSESEAAAQHRTGQAQSS